tara:strand:- start:418 stop:573 length:156 start_codon:yes stop_codon:yes gene_type:complete
LKQVLSKNELPEGLTKQTLEELLDGKLFYDLYKFIKKKSLLSFSLKLSFTL